MRFHRLFAALAAFACLSTSSAAQEETSAPPPPFPPDEALAHDVDPGKLAELGTFARELCETEEVVGVELLVIKDGRTLLHEAYGWRDRDEEEPMVPDSVFCVRSMTKPVIGTAIQMLADEGKLALDDPVAKHLASFDNDRSRAITVEQLLYHTGGLPLTLLLAEDLSRLEDITEVAALAGDHGPEFEPGTRFWYSDPGADSLAAVVEAASGVHLEEFLRTRILEPLEMGSTTCRMSEGHPLRERASSTYAGRRGEWTRFWSPADPPIFPFLLGSQSLYSTPVDYARFLDLWLKKGRRGDGERLLSARTVRRALEPGPHPTGMPTGFAKLENAYGQLWQLWIDPEQKKRKGVVAFGHGGSDGTQAWVFPDEQLMVLVFTQSRGHRVGMLVEEKVDQLLRGAAFDPNSLAPELGPYLGYYEDRKAGRYMALLEEDGRLAGEMPGRFILETRFVGEESWKLALDPRVTFTFRRAEDGCVEGLVIQEPDGETELSRLVLSPDLPRIEELIEKVKAAHRVDLLAEVGAVRLTGHLSMPARKIEGSITQLYAAPDRYVMDIDRGTGPQRVAWDGQRATLFNDQEGTLELEGARREQARLESFITLASDWRSVFKKLEILMRIPGEAGAEARLMVRATPSQARPVTLIVGEETGRLLGHLRISEAPMVGQIGVTVRYGDYREVGGMLLPFEIASEFPTPLIGTVTARFEEAEVGVAVEDADFVIVGGDTAEDR